MSAVAAAPVPRETAAPPAVAMAIAEIPCDLIDVGTNVRVDPGELEELAASVRELGVLQPVKVVGPHADGRYRLVWGQRRLLASVAAGKATIPAWVVPSADVDEPGARRSIEQLAENLQRKDLNPIEEAVALREVLAATEGLTQAELAQRLGRSPSWLSNTLRLLGLDDEVQAEVRAGRITESHAKVMVVMPAEAQRKLASRIVDEKLSAHQVESEIRWRLSEVEAAEAKATKTERTIPRVIAALERAETPKDTSLFLHGSYDVDVAAIVRSVRKAGWKRAESKYSWGGRPASCDCTAVRVEISGRSPSLQPTCTEAKHQANGRDAEEEARRALEQERQRQANELHDVVRRDLDIARSRHSVLALIAWALSYHGGTTWATHVARTDDDLLDEIAKDITTWHRIREVDVVELAEAIRATQGPGNAGAGPGRARATTTKKAAAAAAG